MLQNEFQKVDQHSLFKPITKKVLSIDHVNQIPQKFHEAFKIGYLNLVLL